MSLNSYIIKRWNLTLPSVFAGAPTYCERTSYVTYALNAATTIIAVKGGHIRPFYTMQVSRRQTYALAAMG